MVVTHLDAGVHVHMAKMDGVIYRQSDDLDSLDKSYSADTERMKVRTDDGLTVIMPRRQAVRIALSKKQRNRRRYGHDGRVASCFS